MNAITKSLKVSIEYENQKRIDIEVSRIEAEIKAAKLIGGTSLTFDGHCYNTHFISNDKMSFEAVEALSTKYYMAYGYGFGGKGLGYTIVFNTKLVGRYLRYPHQRL